MAKPYKRGNKWYIYVTHKGQRIRKPIGTSKALAQKYQSMIETDLMRGELKLEVADCTIERLFKDYLEYSEINHRPSTTRRYEGAIRYFNIFLIHFYPQVKRVGQLSMNTFEKYKHFRKTTDPRSINDKLPEEMKYPNNCTIAKTKTVNYELKTLKSVFEFGIRRGLCSTNPAKRVSLLKVDDAKQPRFLSEEECQILLENAGEEYPIYYTLLNTGLRLGELLNLKWSDINFSRRILKVQAKKDWKPKAGEREIPLNSGLLGLLKDIKPKRAAKSDYVFKFARRDTAARILRKNLAKFCREHDLEHFSLHDLRHTFASHLVMNGVDLATVQQLLGHRDIQTTMIYAHLAPDHLAGAVEKLNSVLPQICHNRGKTKK